MEIAVVGLGYVGAPLAVELAKHFSVVGFDINAERVEQLLNALDVTGEISESELLSTSARFSAVPSVIERATVYIITVPTPIDEGNVPNLNPVLAATRLVAEVLKPGDVVVYESTVYPGVTEEICVGLLEAAGKWKVYFNVAYSPERINPGDRSHTLTNTTKIVSGDTEETLDLVDSIYSKITKTYRASSIKVAEGAKVIENIQRDVNIALMNELSQIFSRLSIDTNDVIDAASSKWNFQPFRPGLVGGHCISVDPYYLSHKAATQGFIADVILSSRAVNDSMATFVVDQLIKVMSRNRMLGSTPVVTMLGCTFKEDVPDIRNSKAFQIVKLLKPYGIDVQVCDPLASEAEVLAEGIRLVKSPAPADALILAVAHTDYINEGWNGLMRYSKGEDSTLVLMDLKGVLDRSLKPENVELWRP